MSVDEEPLPYKAGDMITLTEDDIQCLRSARETATLAARFARYFRGDKRLSGDALVTIEYAGKLADAALLSVENGRAIAGMAEASEALADILQALGDIVAREGDANANGRTDAEINAELAERIREGRRNAKQARKRARELYDRIDDKPENELPPEIEDVLRNARNFFGFGITMFDAGDVESALTCFEAGHNNWAEARRMALLPAARRGEKVAGGSLNSAHQTNARHIPMRERRMRRMAELIPEMGSVEGAACQCETEGMGGWKAVKSTWYRYNKSSGT